jgi:8-oxo-dGTP pyrophosphatase MutT (NUDIX family)
MSESVTLLDAAVLAPVYRDAAGALRMVFIRRTEYGIHGGQIALPGGRREAIDSSFAETAVREAHEEIGLDPTSAEILEALPIISTVSTGYRIHPYLARIRPTPWRPQAREVLEVLDVAVADLARAELRGELMQRFPAWPEPVRIEFIQLGSHRLWGATYRIVEPLVPRLLAEEWPIAAAV